MLSSACNKKQAKHLDVLRIYDNDVCEIIEEVYIRDKFDK